MVWYGGQFYSLFFLQNVIKVDATMVSYLIAGALLIATPFFVVFGALSDKIGRKPIIMAGCLLAALTYFPIFKGLTHYANPALEAASATSPVVVNADPNTCAFQFDPVGKRQYKDSCDIAKNYLSKAGVPYTNKEAPAGSRRLGADRQHERSTRSKAAASTPTHSKRKPTHSTNRWATR